MAIGKKIGSVLGSVFRKTFLGTPKMNTSMPMNSIPGEMGGVNYDRAKQAAQYVPGGKKITNRQDEINKLLAEM